MLFPIAPIYARCILPPRGYMRRQTPMRRAHEGFAAPFTRIYPHDAHHRRRRRRHSSRGTHVQSRVALWLRPASHHHVTLGAEREGLTTRPDRRHQYIGGHSNWRGEAFGCTGRTDWALTRASAPPSPSALPSAPSSVAEAVAKGLNSGLQTQERRLSRPNQPAER